MAKVTISVNNIPVAQFVKEQESEEKSREIQNFLSSELRSMRFSSRRQVPSGHVRNSSRTSNVGNGSIRCY